MNSEEAEQLMKDIISSKEKSLRGYENINFEGGDGRLFITLSQEEKPIVEIIILKKEGTYVVSTKIEGEIGDMRRNYFAKKDSLISFILSF